MSVFTQLNFNKKKHFFRIFYVAVIDETMKIRLKIKSRLKRAKDACNAIKRQGNVQFVKRRLVCMCMCVCVCCTRSHWIPFVLIGFCICSAIERTTRTLGWFFVVTEMGLSYWQATRSTFFFLSSLTENGNQFAFAKTNTSFCGRFDSRLFNWSSVEEWKKHLN